MTNEYRQHRQPFTQPTAAAAARHLEQSLDALRADQQRPDPVEEPPTGLIDLAAIRAALGDTAAGEVNPAAARWLAGEDDPEPVFGDIYADGDQDEVVAGPDVELVHHIAAEQLAAAGVEVEVVEEPAPAVAPSLEPVPAAPPALPPPAPPAPASISEHDRTLNWASRHDPRSLAFGVRAAMLGSAPLTDHAWPVGPVLDQGTEGACVGFGIVAAVNAMSSGDVDSSSAAAEAIFRRADANDGDGSTGQGTSVLAGLQAAQAMGAIGGYRWCFGTRDLAQALLQSGPVVIGIPWLSGMYSTGPGGLVQLAGDDTGAGHCLAVVGIKLKGPQGQPGPYFTWQNSWGTGYGDGGFGFIHHRDLAQLLHAVGEAAVPTAQAQT